MCIPVARRHYHGLILACQSNEQYYIWSVDNDFVRIVMQIQLSLQGINP